MSHQGVLTLSPEQNTWDNLKAEVGFGSHSEACIPGCLLLCCGLVMEARNHHTGGGEGPNLLFKGTSPITLLLPGRPSLLKILPFSTHWCQRLGSKPLTHGSLRDAHIRTPTQSLSRGSIVGSKSMYLKLRWNTGLAQFRACVRNSVGRPREVEVSYFLG